MLGALDFASYSWEGRPPRQFPPANDDDSILIHCKKPCAAATLREIILFAL